MRNASECCQISKNGYHGHRNNQYQHRVERLAISENTAAQSTKAGQHHTLGTLHEAYFTFQSQSFGTCTHITHPKQRSGFLQ